jgi:hypothetical protein
MKKALLTSALLVLISVNANATPSIEFTSKNNSPETAICVDIAQNGIDSAKTLAKESGINFSKFRKNITCNKLSVNRFNRKYNTIENAPIFYQGQIKTNAIVSVAPDAIDLNSSNECVRAANGKKVMNTSLKCNGINILKFAKIVSRKHNIVASRL